MWRKHYLSVSPSLRLSFFLLFHPVSASNFSRLESSNSYFADRDSAESDPRDPMKNRFRRGGYLNEDFRLTRFAWLAGVQRSAMVV
jgi:hypothetical protein